MFNPTRGFSSEEKRGYVPEARRQGMHGRYPEKLTRIPSEKMKNEASNH